MEIEGIAKVSMSWFLGCEDDLECSTVGRTEGWLDEARLRSYEMDIEMVSNEALEFAISVAVNEDGMDVWIFDIDETLLSSLPYYGQHGYGDLADRLWMMQYTYTLAIMGQNSSG
nr:acid phosphatase 1 [Tanacetum cinerariifolium]